MPVTQQDIARRAKVSRSLVGHVLSGHPGVWVSADTKQRIIHTARELNYQPSASARMLRTGKSGTVGMFNVRPPDQDPHDTPGRLPVGLCADILSSAGFDLKIKVFPDPAGLMTGLREAACSGLCDAFIVSGPHVEQQGVLLEALGVPFAAYGSFDRTHPAWHQVDFDHAAMMSMAVRSLADHGKKRPAMLCYNGVDDYNEKFIAGFKETCLALFGSDANTDMIVRIAGDETSVEVFDSHFDRWMQSPADRRPDSIVMAVESPLLLYVEEQIWRHGMHVGFGPDDFSMTGACIRAYGWLSGD